jgi:hypothetical protein
MSEATNVQDIPVVDGNVKEGIKVEAPKVESPAKDLREIQALIVNGIFPGNVAPQVVKAFHMLESMASKVELEYKHEEEFKARQKA